MQDGQGFVAATGSLEAPRFYWPVEDSRGRSTAAGDRVDYLRRCASLVSPGYAGSESGECVLREVVDVEITQALFPEDFEY